MYRNTSVHRDLVCISVLLMNYFIQKIFLLKEVNSKKVKLV